MAEIERMTVTLPSDMAAAVRAAVDGGDYASNSEVMREALRDWKLKRALQLQELAALKADIDRGLTDLTDLAECLAAMGVPVGGIGTETLTIEGVTSLKEATHSVIPDRIEFGTYAMAVARTAGDVELVGGRLDLIESVVQTLRSAGVTLEATARGVRVQRTNGALHGVDVMTEPYPGFPTDLQAQMMALMTRAEGASMITETVFESRFMHVPELSRMGANVTIHHESALVRGVPKLRGADVMATDLRASVSLAIAALAAEGDTTLHRVYHLDRGYERLEEKLAACGADIERLKG